VDSVVEKIRAKASAARATPPRAPNSSNIPLTGTNRVAHHALYAPGNMPLTARPMASIITTQPLPSDRFARQSISGQVMKEPLLKDSSYPSKAVARGTLPSSTDSSPEKTTGSDSVLFLCPKCSKRFFLNHNGSRLYMF
jgi:hypothetical protein